MTGSFETDCGLCGETVDSVRYPIHLREECEEAQEHRSGEQQGTLDDGRWAA